VSKRPRPIFTGERQRRRQRSRRLLSGAVALVLLAVAFVLALEL